MKKAPKKAAKANKVRLDTVYINQLEHFTPEELAIIKPYIDAAPRDWELHAPEDPYYSKKSLVARDAAHELWYDTPNATDADWSEFPAVLGYKKVPGMAEYYVYKRKNKFYTVASNAFEYNTWFLLGDDFEIISKLHEFTDLKRAINFVISDAKKLSREDMLMTGHISSGGSQPQLTESELISPYEADEIFEKFGVKNAMLLNKDDLKKAFRTLAIKHHPDKGGREEDMKQINAAYESLKVNDGSGESGGTVRPPTRQDYEDSTALEFLVQLREILSKRLNPKTLPIKGKVGIAITSFKGGWMQISFIMRNNRVGLFDVVKRGNKIRIHDPFDYGDEPEHTFSNDRRSKSFFTEFDLNDIDGLVAWIASATKARISTEIGIPARRKIRKPSSKK